MRLLELLKRIEFRGDGFECPECSRLGRHLDAGIHAFGCELKAAIDHFTSVESVPVENRTIETIRYGARFNPLDHEGMK